MKRIFLFLLALFLFSLNNNLRAQDGNSPVSYSNLALQFSRLNVNGDPQSAILPSVALSNGFGGYIDNPASTALIKGSYFNFGLLNNNVKEENIYLGNTFNNSENKTRLGNLGVVYKLPTRQGELVIGAGYNLHTDINRVNRIGGRNNESTITDQFKNPGSDYYDLAFETYAIDYGDVDSTYRESIFRIGFPLGQFPGITQDAEISYSSTIGEYSAFLGTEFQKDLYFGLSLGVISGSYTYRRNFLELDEFNDYDGNFIPSDDPDSGTDIDNILTHDEIDADILGFTMRTGAIYSFMDHYNVGLSYALPSVLNVKESYLSSIETELDDGSEPFFYDIAGDFEYKIRRPAQINIGFAIENIDGLSISTSAEFIDYSNTDVNLRIDPSLDFQDKVSLRQEEAVLDSMISADYKRVTNLKAGVKYLVSPAVELRGGYAFLPGKSKKFEAEKNVYSAGLGFRVSRGVVIDISAQYQNWKDRSVAYGYIDDVSGDFKEEVISESVDNFRVQAGVKFLF